MTGQSRVVGGRYALISEIGRGGMGIVWLGEDRTIGRRVAVKELLLPQGVAPQERPKFEERVLREARTAGRLSDPGIVTVHDVVQEDGGTFIVMELIEAPNLDQVVRAQGALPIGQVLAIAEQLVAALDTAHAAGVVHRDVKPANVLVAPNGRVKLTDFGIAQTTEDTRLTGTGSMIGSPAYFSPERLHGHDAEPASDLWALGATLFFAVEGYGAFDRPTTPAAIHAIMSERPAFRRAHGPLADLITGLLEHNPQTRLNTGQVRYLIEQARHLEVTGPQPIPHPAVAQGPSGTPQRKVHRGALIAAVAVVLAGAVVGVFALTGAFRSDNSAAQQHPFAAPSTTQSTSKARRGGDSAGSAGTPRAVAPTATPPSVATGTNIKKTQTYGEGSKITNPEAVYALDMGWQCFNGADLNQPVTSCTSPHDVEVFGKVQLDRDSETYPGEQALDFKALPGCGDQFNRLTVKDKDKLVFWALVPTELAWDGRARRQAMCLVARLDNGKLTGSVLAK